MKKIYVSILLIYCVVLSINAQEISDNAIGLRLSYSDGIGAEISYQRAITDNYRLEADFGWKDGENYKGFKATGLLQSVMTLDRNFNWYIGIGGGIASYKKVDNINATDKYLFVAGNLGIDYNIGTPLLLSLDFRPEIGFWDDTIKNDDDIDFDIALGLRYQF